jgi:hypothetical protein
MTKPLPTNKERWSLQAKLQKQVDKLHGKDADGDRYAVVEVHDRRDGQWPYIRPVPRVSFDNPTPEQVLAAIDAASSNVERTSRMFEQVHKDVLDYFEKDSHEIEIRGAAKVILGETAIIGQVYDVDVSRWCRWEFYKTTQGDSIKSVYTLKCYSYTDMNDFSVEEFKKWLRAGKRSLMKQHGKQIKGWFVRTVYGGNQMLAALVETPEKERPAIIALKRAKQDFLNEYVQAIQWAADKIEAELRAKK